MGIIGSRSQLTAAPQFASGWQLTAAAVQNLKQYPDVAAMYLQSQEQYLRFRVPVSGKVPVFSRIKIPVPVKVPVFENLEFLVPVFSCLPVSGFSSSFMSIIEKLYKSHLYFSSSRCILI